jgi:hypothetical protein
MSSREIAEALGCSPTAAAARVRRARRAWRRRSADDCDNWVADEIARVEWLFGEAFAEWERSKRARQSRTIKEAANGRQMTVQSGDQAGSASLLAELRHFHERLCALKELAARERPPSAPDLLPAELLSDDQLARIAGLGAIDS